MEKVKKEKGRGITIYIGNLKYSRDEKGIRWLFSKFGKVTSVEIIVEPKTGNKTGYAFVKMESEEAGQKAIKQLDGSIVDGRTLKVSKAIESRPPRQFTKRPKDELKKNKKLEEAAPPFKKRREKKKTGLDKLLEMKNSQK